MNLELHPRPTGLPAPKCATGCAPTSPDEALCQLRTRAKASSNTASWEANLASVGLSSLTWPKELGGRGSDLTESADF